MPKTGDAKAEKSMMLAVATRPIDNDTTFSTGADVSRFQRRSVPARAPTSAAPTAGGPVAAGPAYGAPVPVGPVIRIARGNSVTEVPVGGK